MRNWKQPTPQDCSATEIQLLPGTTKSGTIRIAHVMVTPEDAQAALNTWDGNRTKSRSGTDRIAHDMRNGLWQTLSADLICFDERGQLVNGQHRFQAVIQSGNPQGMLVAWGLPHQMFKVVDTGRKRTLADVLGILGERDPRNLASLIKAIHARETRTTPDTVKFGVHGGEGHKVTNTLGALERFWENDVDQDVVKMALMYGRRLATAIPTPPLNSTLAIYRILTEGDDVDESDIERFVDGFTKEKIRNPESDYAYQLVEKLRRDKDATMPHYKQHGPCSKLIIKVWNMWRSEEKITPARIRVRTGLEYNPV